MIRIITHNKKGEAKILLGDTWLSVETQADEIGAVRFEDELGGIFRKIEGNWVFVSQRKPNH